MTDAAPPRRSLKRSLSWSAFGEIIFAGCSLLVLVMLGKFGSAEVLGAYTYAMALVTPAIIFTNLHLRPAYVVEPEGTWEYGHYLALRTLLLPLVLLLAAAVALLNDDSQLVVSVLFAVTLFRVAESMADIVLAAPQRAEDMRPVGISRAARGAAKFLGIAAGVFLLDDSTTGIWLGAGATLLLTLSYDRHTLKGFGGYRPRFERRLLVDLARRTLPVGMAAGLLNLCANVPAYVIEAQHDLSRVGEFGVLLSILSAGGMVNVIVGNAAIPRLAQHAWKDQRRFRITLAKLVGLVAVAHAGIVLGVFVLGDLYLSILGPEFTSLGDTLILAAAAGMLSGFTNLLSQAVSAMGRFRAQLVVSGTALVPSLGLALWLIPEHPLRGALAALAAVAIYRGFVFFWLIVGGKTVSGSARSS